MFCPICGCEYKEGIKVCADCNADLCLELPEDFGSEDLSDTEVLMQNYEEHEKEEMSSPYISKAQMAEDNKSSGYAMIGVGGVGLIVMILIITGIIPLRLFGNGMYLTYGVMIALFVIFLVIGIKSLLLTKQYLIDAEIEDNLKSDIINWFISSFSYKEIDSDAHKTSPIEELPDIEIYYKRMDNIKDKINAKYVDLSPAFLEHLCEEIYENLYEN